MPNITEQQAMELSKHFSSMSNSVAQYRYNKWDTLTVDQRKQLSDDHWTLANDSDDFLRLAAQLILNDAIADLGKIKNVTQQIESTIDQIKKIEKVFDIISAALELGGAIMAKDPALIVKKIDNLSKLVNSTRSKKDEKNIKEKNKKIVLHKGRGKKHNG
ncbi:MAG: hypothetical protein H0W12_02655 [Chitinophagaceae bacterium]|nr:hypothetical protein [Chitinophagaceae bacterium]